MTTIDINYHLFWNNGVVLNGAYLRVSQTGSSRQDRQALLVISGYKFFVLAAIQ
jgi:hypothetical protein